LFDPDSINTPWLLFVPFAAMVLFMIVLGIILVEEMRNLG